MIPRSYDRDGFGNLIAEATSRIDAALPPPSPVLTNGDNRPPNIKDAARKWRTLRTELMALDRDLDALGEECFAIRSNADLTETARSAQLTATADRLGVGITATANSLVTGLGVIVASVRDAGHPSRPEPRDALQETTLAGLKVDAQMVLDAVDVEDLPEAIADRLSRAMADDDALAAWLLASSRWPADYVASRNASWVVEELNQRVGQVLDRAASGQLAATRRAYDALAHRDAVNALSQALTVLLPSILSTYRDGGSGGYNPQNQLVG